MIDRDKMLLFPNILDTPVKFEERERKETRFVPSREFPSYFSSSFARTSRCSTTELRIRTSNEIYQLVFPIELHSISFASNVLLLK